MARHNWRPPKRIADAQRARSSDWLDGKSKMFMGEVVVPAQPAGEAPGTVDQASKDDRRIGVFLGTVEPGRQHNSYQSRTGLLDGENPQGPWAGLRGVGVFGHLGD